jgi:hypothetical protein
MGLLQCQLFQAPPAVHDRLARCAVNDSDHIPPGSTGEHVRKLQRALNRLSIGPGKENFNLDEDAIYGPATANAVKRYKGAPNRRILQPWQTTADDIVGKRTIKSLDAEMNVLEKQLALLDPFVCRTYDGVWPHDHSQCPMVNAIPEDAESGPDGRVTHIATPVNPQGTGRKICIGGAREVQYLGFEDFVPDPAKDPSYLKKWALGRPFTTRLADDSVSDICFRSTPIDKWMRQVEMPRICALGCRLTYGANDYASLKSLLPFFQSLGPIIHWAIIYEERPANAGPYWTYWAGARHTVVVQMLLHKRA